jgi:hypothetical protein
VLRGLPVPDERTITNANEVVCSAANLDAIVASNVDEYFRDAGILPFGFEEYCRDPCRCVGECGFHSEEAYPRPFCHVQDSLA